MNVNQRQRAVKAVFSRGFYGQLALPRPVNFFPRKESRRP